MIKETNAPEETFAFGKMLGEQAKPGEVICLNGDLGVGNRRGEFHPAQKIVSGAFARMQQGIGGLRFGLDVGGNFNARLGNVQFHIFHHIAN